MKHRIFVTLGVSEKLKKAIFDWEESFRKEHPETWSQIRWLTPENLHITLVPPWYEDDEGVEKTKELLHSVEKRSFSLDFRQISYGPNPKQPRLIWIEGQTSKDLIELKDNILSVLDRRPENRLFRLHLTIARFRPEKFGSFSPKRIEETLIFREESAAILLMESHLLRSGSEYVVLERFSITD